MDAFLAFLDHVHSMLTTTYHNTPIVLMASPQWTRPDCEAIARYIFEKTRTPALCLIHSGVATQYGLRWPSMTVVDIGYEKVDVTCIYENRLVSHRDVLDVAGEGRISGGEVFTKKLLQLLNEEGHKEFNHDMAEQLKKSAICEVLPYAADRPDLMELPTAIGAASVSAAPAAAATTTAAPASVVPAQPSTVGTDVATGDADDGNGGEDKTGDNDGVLDIANIVTSGQTKEFLAKKEKEKAEKAKAGKKGKGAEASDANRPARLPNSKREKNVFHYEEIVQGEPAAPPAPAAAPAQPPISAPPPVPASASEETKETKETNGTETMTLGEEPKKDEAAPAPAADDEQAKSNEQAKRDEQPKGDEQAKSDEQPKGDEQAKSDDQPRSEGAAAAPEADKEQEKEKPTEQSSNDPFKIDNFMAPPEPASAPGAPAEPTSRRVRRDIEIGLERFKFADRAEIDRIATAIYDAVQNIGDMYMRPACWENLVFVGNGSRIRGLKDNIVQTLTARHLVSPSSATMFTSELPSNMATPSGTGSQTPTGSFTGPPHTVGPASSGVNPLLQAATTASLQQAQQQQQAHPGMMTPGGQSGDGQGQVAASHHFHSQTPTAIKIAPMPTYLAEWTKHGFEEAMFLGSLVAARMAFCVHNIDAHGLEAQRLMSLNRVDYK